MFDAFKRLFSGEPAPAGGEEMTPQLAAAALMVEAAYADGVYAKVEEEKIRAVLRESFQLDEGEAADLLGKAEGLVDHAVDHHRFTRAVKQGLAKETRLKLMESLWAVVMADGEKDHAEDSLLRRLSPLLALSDRERAEARQRALARNGR